MFYGVPMRLTAVATAGPRQDGHVPVESTFTGPPTTTRPCSSPDQGHFSTHTHLNIDGAVHVVRRRRRGRQPAAGGAHGHAHVDHPVAEDDVGDAVDDDTRCERTLLFEAPADAMQSLLE